MNSAYNIVMTNRQELVSTLIKQMEKGYYETTSAWNNLQTGSPYNPVSKINYRAGNRFRLMIASMENNFKDPRWMTFKQAAEQNYKIKPGSKGVLLEKWIFYRDVPVLDPSGKPVLNANLDPMKQRIKLNPPYVNYFRVFNGEQISGLPDIEHPSLSKDSVYYIGESIEKSSQCPIYYELQNDNAYYSLTDDAIHLPPKEAFKNNDCRLSTLLHEMCHSTGHKERLNRNMSCKFGSTDYAKEELNAELGALFLESELGLHLDIDTDLMKDHSNYVKSWISILKDDPNELFRSCATADKICEYLMENYHKCLELEATMAPTIESSTYENKLLSDMAKNSLKPTKKIIDSIKNLNALTHKQNSLSDIQSLYKKCTFFPNSDEYVLINEIGDALKKQQLFNLQKSLEFEMI